MLTGSVSRSVGSPAAGSGLRLRHVGSHLDESKAQDGTLTTPLRRLYISCHQQQIVFTQYDELIKYAFMTLICKYPGQFLLDLQNKRLFLAKERRII